MNSDSIQQAAHTLDTTQFVTVLTGTGKPTFRDTLDDLWAQSDPQRVPSGEMLPTLLEALGLEA